MKFPKLPKSNTHRAVLQDLTGGLNMHLPSHLIGINQQAEIKNMFFKDGVLKKRPCFKKIAQIEGYTVTDIETENGLFIYNHQVDNYGYGFFKSAFVGKDGIITHIPDITVYEEYEYENDAHGKYAYCFFPYYFNGTLYLAIGYSNEYNEFMSRIYRFSDGEFKQIEDKEIYSPLVMINGKGNKFSSLTLGANSVYSPQISFEGINLLTKRVRVQYTTDGSSYSFPFLIGRKAGTPINVKLTGSFSANNNIEEISFTINDDADIVKVPGNSSVSCFITNYTNLTFRKSDNSAFPPLAATFSNNLELEYYIQENPNAKTFFEMSFATPFGASGGSGGGNRLFVAGNKNLLRWSDLNNPLYFPENNFVYISDGEIYALKKQGNMLLIFSDNEIHYATYLGGSFNAEDFISGSIGDITAVSALFPITQMHSALGLYCKNAATICNNKIIFLGNDKKLYRIDSSNKITHISQKIDRFLSKSDITTAAAGRYLNYFLLSTNAGIIAFNTENESFYIWDDEINAGFIYSNENPIIIADDGIYALNETEDFEFGFTTATFDLGLPEKFKSLNKIIVMGEGGEIAVVADDGQKTFRKIKKNTPIFLNVKRTKSFSLTFKNCDNFEGVIFYYNLY